MTKGLAVAMAVATLSLSASPAGAQPAKPGFDGDAALRYAREQVAFGPRVPGTAAAQRAGDWLVQQMRLRTDTVIVQQWTHRTAAGALLPMRNIFAQIRPELTDRVLYVAHWDTRPFADAEYEVEARARAGDGANDGAAAFGFNF